LTRIGGDRRCMISDWEVAKEDAQSGAWLYPRIQLYCGTPTRPTELLPPIFHPLHFRRRRSFPLFFQSRDIYFFIFDPHSPRPFIIFLHISCSSLHHSFSCYCYYGSLTTNSFVTFFCVESLLQTYVITHSCRFYFSYCTIIFLLLSFKCGSNIVVIARDCISGRLYSRLMQKPS
jgi:hypothetical protein